MMNSIKYVVIYEILLLNLINAFVSSSVRNYLKMKAVQSDGCNFEINSEDSLFEVYCKSIIDIRKYYSEFNINNYNVPCSRTIYYNGYNYCGLEVVLEDYSTETITDTDTFDTPKQIFQNVNDDFLILSLDISNNFYESFPILNQMTNLQKLNMSHNKLTVANLYNDNAYDFLEVLDLSYNRISYIFKDETEMSYKSIKYLNISHNDLSEIPIAVFSNLLDLEHLDLSYNNILKLNSFAFEGLQKLHHLQLTHNKLCVINSSLFRFIVLEELYLNDNNIEEILFKDFEHFSALKVLDISNNSINTIENNAFSNLISLTSINLKNNQLRTIDKNIFKNTEPLQDIDLSYNKIIELPLYSFKGKNISSFSIIGNSLEGILKKGIFEGLQLITQLNLSYQKIYSIQDYAFYGVENIHQLILNNNDISILTEKSFKLLIKLNHLDLSYNHILSLDFDKEDLLSLEFLSLYSNNIQNVNKNHLTSLTKLQFLDLSINNISKLETHSFEFQATLLNLQISDNPLQSFLEENTFHGLSSIPSLDLSCTNLSIINNGSFDGMTHLNELNISHSKLSEVKFNSFINTGNIKIIDFSYNLLSYFDVNSTQLTNIQVLLINNNFIKTLPVTCFNSMKQLNKLSLSTNSLKTLNSTIFANQILLQELDMSNNVNLKINVSYLENLSNLNVLNLTGTESIGKFTNLANVPLKVLEFSFCNVNNITKLELQSLVHLSYLSLYKNNITMLEVGALKKLNNLRQLDISNNNIVYIQPGAFGDNYLLEMLNISHNNIKMLDYGVLRGLNHILILDISYNYINSLEKEKFYEVHTLKELIADNNLINEITMEDFRGTSIEKISIGGNPLSCKALANLKKESGPSLKITAINLIEDSIQNSYGVSCVSNNDKFKLITGVENNNYTFKIFSDFHEILQKSLEKSNTDEKYNKEISVNFEKLNQNYINSNTENIKELSSIFNISNEIKQTNVQTNSLLERILKVLVASNPVKSISKKEEYVIKNSTNKDIIESIKNDLQRDLENTLVLEKEKMISDIDEKIQMIKKQVQSIQLKSENKTLTLSKDDLRSPLFVEIGVVLILIILICIILYKVYKHKIYYVNRRTLSTRHMSEVIDNSTL